MVEMEEMAEALDETEGQKVGRKIKALRKRCGLTQEKVANHLEISQSYLRKIEHGKANPSVNMAGKITKYLEQYLEKKLKGLDTEEMD